MMEGKGSKSSKIAKPKSELLKTTPSTEYSDTHTQSAGIILPTEVCRHPAINSNRSTARHYIKHCSIIKQACSINHVQHSARLAIISCARCACVRIAYNSVIQGGKLIALEENDITILPFSSIT